MRVRRTIALLAAVSLAVIGLASPSAAAVPRRDADNGPWTRFSTAPFTDPPGAACDFAVHGDIVYDLELIRTLSADPPVVEILGPLGIRYTNVSNGTSVFRDVSGVAVITSNPDGSQRWELWGSVNIAIPAGDPYVAEGEWVVRGHFVLIIHADRTRELPVRDGTMENLCDALT